MPLCQMGELINDLCIVLWLWFIIQYGCAQVQKDTRLPDTYLMFILQISRTVPFLGRR